MPSGPGRRATAPSPLRAGRPRRRAMRISKHILSVAMFGVGLGLTVAHALDLKTPADRAPTVGVPVAPDAALGASSKLKAWARALRAGDIAAAQRSLEDAARDGDVMAAWKLGRMYADGD